MSKVRTSGKSRKAVKTTTTSSSSSMGDDENHEVVSAIAKTLELFNPKSAMDDEATTTTTTVTTKTKKTKLSQDAQDDAMGEGDVATKAAMKKEKKAAVEEILVEAPEIGELTGLLPKKSKLDKKILGLSKEGVEMLKPRSKKERLKMKKQLLVDHIAATNEVVDLHTKANQKNKKGDLFSFSDDLSHALGNVDTESGSKQKINPLTTILNGAGHWKNTKKAKKSLDEDKQKFQEVIEHPAFQNNSINALQQHLTNQMAMMRQIDDYEHGASNKKVDKKVKKSEQGSENKYNKLVKNKTTLASSMRK